MVSINLLPWREEQQDEKRKEIFSLAAVVAIVAVICLVFMHMVFGSSVEKQERRNVYLQTEIDQANKEVSALQSYQDKHKQLTIQLDTIHALQSSRQQLVRLLDELARILPDGIQITKINQEDDVIDINGYAESNTLVNELMRKIADSTYFIEPELNEVIESSSRPGAMRRFRLQLQSNDEIAT